MSLLIDLDHIAPGDRSQAWSRTIRDYYLDLDIRFGSKPYAGGKIARSPLGSIAVSVFAGTVQTHERTPLLMSDDVDHMFGWVQLRGSVRLDQSGRSVDLGPGRFVILDAAQPYFADFRDEFQFLSVRIPRIYFEDMLTSRRELINHCIDERHGSMIIADYFRRMVKSYEDISLEHRVRMSAHGVRLMVDSVAGAANMRGRSVSPSP